MSATSSDEKNTPSPEEQPGLGQQGRSLSETELEPAPDGGLRAWLVVLGAASIFFCCMGFSNSFGTFTEYYLTHQLRHRSPDDVAWIGSLSAFLQFFVGMIGGPSFDRYGSKVFIHIRYVLRKREMTATTWILITNHGIGYSPRGCYLYFRRDDVESMQDILAIHTRTRRAYGHCYGVFTISSHGQRVAIFR